MRTVIASRTGRSIAPLINRRLDLFGLMSRTPDVVTYTKPNEQQDHNHATEGKEGDRSGSARRRIDRARSRRSHSARDDHGGRVRCGRRDDNRAIQHRWCCSTKVKVSVHLVRASRRRKIGIHRIVNRRFGYNRIDLEVGAQHRLAGRVGQAHIALRFEQRGAVIVKGQNQGGITREVDRLRAGDGQRRRSGLPDREKHGGHCPSHGPDAKADVRPGVAGRRRGRRADQLGDDPTEVRPNARVRWNSNGEANGCLLTRGNVNLAGVQRNPTPNVLTSVSLVQIDCSTGVARPGIDIGSYPWFRDGNFGVSLVSRGTDAAILDVVVAEISRMVRDLGGEPVEEESA